MPDTQIHPTGVVQAPGDFVIPSSAELLLKMAYASFDGSGAASSFKPLLRIISDAGTVCGEAVADDVVAAGASADVTWFPRVGAAAAAAATVGTVPTLSGRLFGGTTLTVPAHSIIDIPWDTATSTDSTQLDWNAGFPTVVSVAGGGVIATAITITPAVDWPNSAAGYVRFFADYDGTIPVATQQIFAAYDYVDVFSPPTTGPWSVTALGIASAQAAGPFKGLVFKIQNTTAVDWKATGDNGFFVARLSAWNNA